MSDAEYLLSIVIPTRNRQKYAAKAVEQALSVTDDRVQLVVQDNSDSEDLRDLIATSLKHHRLKYNYTDGVLSFVDNFSEAISLVDAEYLCIIGDDDGIMPEIVAATQWLKENDIDALVSAANAVYIWPSKHSIVKRNGEHGYLCISYASEQVKLCDTRQALMKLMEYGGQKYLSLDMAKVYHGIVRKRCMDTVKNATGRYFGGLSPDIYGAVALSLIAQKVVKIGYPVTISGICETSGSADSATGRHTGDLNDAPHFVGHASYDWSREVPRFYSVETIWADTALHALRELRAHAYVDRFSILALDAYCLRNHRSFRDAIWEHCRSNRISRIRLLLDLFRLSSLDFAAVWLKRALRKKSDVIKLHNIQDIHSAQRVVSDQLRERNIHIEDVVSNLHKLLRQRR